jgi:hypothetical protein
MAASDMVHASPYLEVFLWLRKYGVRNYGFTSSSEGGAATVFSSCISSKTLLTNKIIKQYYLKFVKKY